MTTEELLQARWKEESKLTLYEETGIVKKETCVTYAMNPSPKTCRQLTLYLGECWHTKLQEVEGYFSNPFGPNDIWVDGYFQCPSCGKKFYNKKKANRTFTTPADLFAVYGKMVERREWGKFFIYTYGIWSDEAEFGLLKYDEMFSWLFCLAAPSQIGERMEMVSAWLKEKEQ